ncbi:MAG: amidohydrolase family protein [Polyangiales bacterium]
MRGLAAAWVITGLPGEAPIEGGAVVLDAESRVVAVGTEQALRAAHADARWERHEAVLTPGLVNAHVHLELSALRGETKSGGGFGPWAASMMARRAVLQPEDDAEAIEAGVSELLRAGTAAIGDISNTLRSVPALTGVPLLGRVFHEIFGYAPDAARTLGDAARAARAQVRDWPANLSHVLAPHTLFTLHADAVRALVAEAREAGVRTSLHLAEHAAEIAFLRDGTGPFAAFLAERGVPAGAFVPPGRAPVAYGAALGVLGPEVIAVHLCAATRDELAAVAAAHMPAVLCPRSNLYIELKLPPLYDVLAVGLRPGLGTDSLASNTTLDVLAEASALADRFPAADRGTLFSMASWHGAEALGLSHRVGALKPGLSPGVLAFDLARPAGEHGSSARAPIVDDPLRHILRSPPPVRRVLARPSMPKRSLEEVP